MTEDLPSRQREIEINMAEIKTELRYIKKDINKVSIKIDDFIDCAEQKFASKSTESKLKAVQIELDTIKIKSAKLYGAALVIWFILQIAMKYFLRM